MRVHATYGEPALPELQVIRLEENIAEKISRLNRTTTARDLYDLAWLATHQRDVGILDTDLIRRLVVLKVWVDSHGVSSATSQWRPGHEARSFDPDQWLRTRLAAEVDLDDIGALAVPSPSLDDLNATINAHSAPGEVVDQGEADHGVGGQPFSPFHLRRAPIRRTGIEVAARVTGAGHDGAADPTTAWVGRPRAAYRLKSPPPLTLSMNRLQTGRANASVVPSRSLVSRTRTAPGRLSATSTQFCWSLKVDLCQRAPVKSGRVDMLTSYRAGKTRAC